MLSGSALTIAWRRIVVIAHFRREKFLNRKLDAAENFAWILSVAAALFFWDTIIVSRNKELNFTLKVDNREQPQRHINVFRWSHGAEVAFKLRSNGWRNACLLYTSNQWNTAGG